MYSKYMERYNVINGNKYNKRIIDILHKPCDMIPCYNNDLVEYYMSVIDIELGLSMFDRFGYHGKLIRQGQLLLTSIFMEYNKYDLSPFLLSESSFLPFKRIFSSINTDTKLNYMYVCNLCNDIKHDINLSVRGKNDYYINDGPRNSILNINFNDNYKYGFGMHDSVCNLSCNGTKFRSKHKLIKKNTLAKHSLLLLCRGNKLRYYDSSRYGIYSGSIMYVKCDCCDFIFRYNPFSVYNYFIVCKKCMLKMYKYGINRLNVKFHNNSCYNCSQTKYIVKNVVYVNKELKYQNYCIKCNRYER